MILNLGSLSFNANIESGGGTPAWGTELGQGEGYKFTFEDMSDFFTGMVYCSIPDLENVTCPLGKGGNQRADYDFVIAGLFNKVYVNGIKVENAQFLLLVIKKIVGDHHVGRRTIKYNPKMTYNGKLVNEDCYKKMTLALGWNEDSSWFVHEIIIRNQDELHFYAYQLGEEPIDFASNDERKNAFLSKLPKDGMRKFHEKANQDPTLQQIYYGAPGTGKSHEIKEQTAEAEKQGRVIRTTFHPDSDYSTFVGCYKPSISHKPVRNVAGDEVKKGDEIVTEEVITYQFTPQAFTNAYVKAWNNSDEPVFLIIEEINRGNCAQIFGDLFQLLDRGDDGVSDYPIKADTDLCKYLEKELGEDGSEGIKDGKLCLPANLHIWATMNTSDQSLFPIDSAFKRRWDWTYVPISDARKNWKIKVLDNKYDWWEFLQKINERVESATNSEDKQLGYFFCKADDEGTISAEKFVSKVVFYLWNDVFKDFADASDDPFKSTNDKRMTFRSFYSADDSGKAVVNEDNIEQLLKNINCVSSIDPSSSFIAKYKGQIIDGSARSKYFEIITKVVEENGADAVAACLGADLTNTPDPNTTRNYKQINDTGWYLATNNCIETIKGKLKKVKETLGVDIDIE